MGEAGSTVPGPREMGKDHGWVEGGERGGRGSFFSTLQALHCSILWQSVYKGCPEGILVG